MTGQDQTAYQSSSSAMPSARRRDAIRHLLKPIQIRDSLELKKQPSLRNSSLAGLQAALTVAIALPITYISPWSDMMGFASLGALVALFGRFAPERRRSRIVFLCAICQTLAVFALSGASLLGASEMLKLAILSISCGLFFFISVTGQFGAPGALIFIFAAGASMGDIASMQDLVRRVATTGAVSLLAWIICMATETLRHTATPENPFPAEPLRPLGHRMVASVRIALGAMVAVFASLAVGAAHPAWAAMGAVAVMQGAYLHVSMNRALQRTVGTAIGAAIVWLILIHSPSAWAVIAILIVLQFATEVVIGTNYALGQILVTPMALLMSYLAAPQVSGPAMAPERVLDTLLGVTIGMIIAVLLSTIDDRAHLANRNSP